MPRYTPISPAELDWENDAPHCRQHKDIYFSSEGGIEETQYVFLQGNKLPERWLKHDSFTIAETGFGTGLNFLCTISAWLKNAPPSARLHFISVEKHPLRKPDLQRALDALPSLSTLSKELIDNYPPVVHGLHRINLFNNRITLTLLIGDAGEMFADLNAKVDAWFLDGFAPSKNPDMWSEQLFKHIARLSKPQATFATFTAAGIVKRGLKAVGFNVNIQKGFGRKRDMLVGEYQGEEEQTSPHPWFHYSGTHSKTKDAIVIGAGLAGCSVAHALTQRNWNVTVIDRSHAPAQGASGNHSGVVMPRLTADMGHAGRFYLSAFLHTYRWLDKLINVAPELSWHKSGVLQLSTEKQIKQLSALKLPEEILSFHSAEQASEICGTTINQASLFFANAGWIQPPQLCQLLLNTQRITTLFNTEVLSIKKENNSWQVWSNNQCIAQANTMIITNGYDAETLLNTDTLKLQKVRGQITYLPTNEHSKELKTPVCYDGYIIPAYHDQHCAGATYDTKSHSLELKETDTQEIIHNLESALPNFNADPPSSGRAAFRTSTQDHLPIVGPVPDYDFYKQNYNDLHHGKPARLYKNAKYQEGLFISTGHGSRGLISCPMAAEIIAATLNDEPMPLTQDQLDAIHPGRYLIRSFKRPS